MPVTITRPRAARIASTAATKCCPSPSDIAAASAATPSRFGLEGAKSVDPTICAPKSESSSEIWGLGSTITGSRLAVEPKHIRNSGPERKSLDCGLVGIPGNREIYNEKFRSDQRKKARSLSQTGGFCAFQQTEASRTQTALSPLRASHPPWTLAKCKRSFLAHQSRDSQPRSVRRATLCTMRCAARFKRSAGQDRQFAQFQKSEFRGCSRLLPCGAVETTNE